VRRLALAVLLFAAVARAQGDLPDPTRPEVAPAAAAEPEKRAARFELGAVLIGSERRVALINGVAVAVGESVDGAEVLAIQPGRVRIRTSEGEQELSLAPAVRVVPAEEEDR
jgi:MSHA biogenesis protein MshK